MKHTRLFALMAIVVAALFSSASLTASPPVAFDHPLALSSLQPSVLVETAVLATATKPAAVELACEIVNGSMPDIGASVPGVKRVGGEADYDNTLLRTDLRRHPARAVRA